MVVTATLVPKNLLGRVLVLMSQTHNLSTETGQEVSMTEMHAHPRGGRMTAIVPLTVKPIIHPMKRGGNLTRIARSHALTHTIATMTGTGIMVTTAEITLIGPLQDLQDILLRNL